MPIPRARNVKRRTSRGPMLLAARKGNTFELRRCGFLLIPAKFPGILRRGLLFSSYPERWATSRPKQNTEQRLSFGWENLRPDPERPLTRRDPAVAVAVEIPPTGSRVDWMESSLFASVRYIRCQAETYVNISDPRNGDMTQGIIQTAHGANFMCAQPVGNRIAYSCRSQVPGGHRILGL